MNKLKTIECVRVSSPSENCWLKNIHLNDTWNVFKAMNLRGSKGHGQKRVFLLGCGGVPQSTSGVTGCLPQLWTCPDSPCILAWYSVHCEPDEQWLSLSLNAWQTSHCNSRYTYPSRKGRPTLGALLGKQEYLIRIPFKAYCSLGYRWPSLTPPLTHTPQLDPF